MQQGEIEFRTFGPEHIEGAVALSRQENWPHRPQDWQMALQLSSGAVALDNHGRVTGTLLVTPYGADCATISMVIVDRNQRGKGLGRRLMERAFALAGDRPLRLTATADGIPLYEKLGFVPSGRILQHQGKVAELGTPGGVEATGTDDLPEIKAMLRVCAFHLYGWACEHPSVAEQADKVRSGWIPEGYPKSWPSPERPSARPPGTAPFSERIEKEIAKRKRRIKASMENARFVHYPRAEVIEVLKFWGIRLEQ